jgi:hypothetical protein
MLFNRRILDNKPKTKKLDFFFNYGSSCLSTPSFWMMIGQNLSKRKKNSEKIRELRLKVRFSVRFRFHVNNNISSPKILNFNLQFKFMLHQTIWSYHPIFGLSLLHYKNQIKPHFSIRLKIIFTQYRSITSFITFLILLTLTKGEGSTAQNPSARKNCSTPKSRLLDTIRADEQIYETARINFFKWIKQIRADVNNIIICSKCQAIAIQAVDYFI